MSPAVTPHPAEPCLLGLAVLVGSWVVAGAAAFVIGTAIARRRWPA